jgi:hypothetical protein
MITAQSSEGAAAMRLKRKAEKNAEVLLVKTEELIARMAELRQERFRN